MKTIKVKPVEIIGNCRANLTLADEYQIKGMNLVNPRQSNLCFMALSNLPPIIALLQSEDYFFAHCFCPDCLARLDCENRVIFLLGHADKWELCQAISEYRRLCRQYGEESELARELEELALEYQKRGEYVQAVKIMAEAVAELKRVIA
jgi:hypothetical protein